MAKRKTAPAKAKKAEKIYSIKGVPPRGDVKYSGVVVDPTVRDDAEYIPPQNRPMKMWDEKAGKFVIVNPLTKKDLRKPNQRPRRRDWA